MPSGRAAQDDVRRRFVADPQVLAELELSLADLADPDMRALVIRREHPEFEEALQAGQDELEVAGAPMSPRLHIAMHEIVATQVWDDDPQEVWQTATRLLQLGYERHEVLHMLARPVATSVWGALHDDRPHDREGYHAALRALPGSWERERTSMTAQRRHDDGRKASRKAARAARRGNRRPR
jgi:hypothetical protein